MASAAELCSTDTENRLSSTFQELKIKPEDRESVESLLRRLKENDQASYEHSLRVGLLAKSIGDFLGEGSRPLFFAGLLHDVGKAEVPAEILGKTGELTEEDFYTIRGHVAKGYEMLKGRFDFTAEIVLLHHTFQEKGYPKVLPMFLHDYSPETQGLIYKYSRTLALADVYDALHRENSRFGEKRRLSDDEIRAKMIELNPSQNDLVYNLYKAGVFH